MSCDISEGERDAKLVREGEREVGLITAASGFGVRWQIGGPEVVYWRARSFLLSSSY